MAFLRHLNFGLIVYCIIQVWGGAETKKSPVTDVVSTTEFQNHTQDVKRILSGIDNFYVEPNMGTLTVYGGQALSIAAGTTKSNNTLHPIIAGGTIGKGKVIGFADEHFLEATYPDPGKRESSQRKLLLNTVKWACSEAPTFKILNIGFYNGCCQHLNNWFKHNKLNTSKITAHNIINLSALDKFHVIVTNKIFHPHEIPIVVDYVKQGGNLIMGQLAKGQATTGHFGMIYPANIISAHAGFVWRNSNETLVFKKKFRIPTATNRLQYTHLLDAWSIIKDVPKGLNSTEKQAYATVESALVSISPIDPFWEANFPLTETLHNVLRKAIFS